MTKTLYSCSRVLAIDPCTRGFAFVVIEGGTRIIDWGIARLYSKHNEEFRMRLDAMIQRYRPTAIVFEDVAGADRRKRAAKQINHLIGYAGLSKIESAIVSRGEVRQALGLQRKSPKYEVASAIAILFPELGATLPSPRKPWQTEDERMNVFDAVGLALAHPCHR